MCEDGGLEELMLEDPYDLRMREILERAVDRILEEAHRRDPSIAREVVVELLCERQPDWRKWL